MEIAVKNGDPNNINKVIKSILELVTRSGSMTADQQQISSYQDVVRLISAVPDGLRHLRNYAKKRILVQQNKSDMQQVFQALYLFVNTQSDDVINKSGLKKSDITECHEIIR
jgi:hypothetical protein